MSTSRQIICPHCDTANRLPAERPAEAAKCGACHRPLFTGAAFEVDEEGLGRHLRSGDLPVLLDVWAPWCGPCRAMAPNFTRAAAVLEPQVRLLKLNADTAPTVCRQLGVSSIPALFLLRGNQVLGRTVGAMSAEQLVSWTRQQLAAAQTA